MPQNMDDVIRVKYVMKKSNPQAGILEIKIGHLMLKNLLATAPESN